CFACSKISVGCSSCDNKTCFACLPPRFLDENQCLMDCPVGKWGNTVNRQCTACLEKCETCSNNNTCDTCFQNRVPQQCNSCFACSKISVGCSSCDNKTCFACLPPRFLDENQCLMDCPVGKWGNTVNRQCTACLEKCETCSNNNTCDTCFQNRVPQQCNSCFACSKISVGCSSCDNKTCFACLPPRFLDENSCLMACPVGKWGNTANRQCTACLEKCETCSNNNTCDTCFQNRVPQQCNCPQYSYDTNVFNQACTMCSTFQTGCATCSATECLTCITPYYFQLNSNGQCDSCLTIMTKMYFSDDLLYLIIDFGHYFTNLQVQLILYNLDLQNYSSQIQFTNQLCIETLDQAFISFKLQGNILCSFDKYLKTLTVKLDSVSTVNKDDIIKIKPSVFKITNNGFECPHFLQQITGKVILDTSPVIELTQTSPVSICQQAQIRISSVSNCGNRKLKQITWTLISSNVNTANEINEINIQIQQYNNQLYLEIRPLLLKKQGQYQFQVTVTTFFNQAATANAIIQTLADTSIDIRVKQNPSQIYRSSLVNVSLNFDILQCEDDRKIFYNQENVYEVQIKQHDNLTEQLNIDFTQQIQGTQFQFQIKPFIMKVSTTYNIQIIASLKSDTKITQQILFPVQVLSNPPLVQILGGNRQQLFSQNFDIQAIVDDPNLSPSEKDLLKSTNYGINIKWQCINLNTGNDCKDAQNNLIVSPIKQNLQISIQKNILKAYQQYQFKLSGTKDGVTASDQITILMVDYSVPPVNPTISINNTQNTINLNQEIFIQFDCQEDTNVDDLIITGVILYQKKQVSIISIITFNQDLKFGNYSLTFKIKINLNQNFQQEIRILQYQNQFLILQMLTYLPNIVFLIKLQALKLEICKTNKFLQQMNVLIEINLCHILSIFIKTKMIIIMNYQMLNIFIDIYYLISHQIIILKLFYLLARLQLWQQYKIQKEEQEIQLNKQQQANIVKTVLLITHLQII
ncbi:leishmanolysin family protein, putative, partial [Ichthyophthirius multifiliis]